MSIENRKDLVEQAVANLYPGYFALVMATGIISIAAGLVGMTLVAWLLFEINLAAYLVLWVLTLARLVHSFPRVWSDLIDHARGPGFFTLIAGTCVLGRQFLVLAQEPRPALVLWALGLALWCLLMYTFLAAVTLREPKPGLETGLNGSWLLIVVGTQSISVLSARLADYVGAWQAVMLFLTLAFYLLGFVLYVLIIVLIFYRFTFFSLSAASLTPPYWINMGAMAITTLAGSIMMLEAAHWPFLSEVLAFVKGLTLLFWVTATWWIPLLFILGVWRHLFKRYPFSYDPQYWGMAFPLGMYSACTILLSQATGFTFLLPLAEAFAYIALIFWLIVFVGMLYRLISRLIVPSLASQPSQN